MKKGMALLWVLVISAILLLVSGTMATLIIKTFNPLTGLKIPLLPMRPQSLVSIGLDLGFKMITHLAAARSSIL
jgi:hypothetical protein